MKQRTFDAMMGSVLVLVALGFCWLGLAAYQAVTHECPNHACPPCDREHHVDGDGCKSPPRTGVVR